MSESPAGEAFRRLMAEARASDHARVDALVACSQRSVWVATWEPASATWRTLEHEDGHTALPVFSDEGELDRAANELEWNRGAFRVARREISARQAMRHVMSDQLSYFVIDVASDHCVEATRAEIEPLARVDSRSDSQGPFAAVGRITSTMIEAVRTSQAPTGIAIMSTRESSHPPQSLALPSPSRISPPPAAPAPPSWPKEKSDPALEGAPAQRHRESSSPTLPSLLLGPDADSRHALAPTDEAIPAQDTNASIIPMSGDPPEIWLDSFSAALKPFPEIEFACFALVSFGGSTPIPMIGMRVEPSFRHRLPEIGLAVAHISASLQIRVGTLLLDQPTTLRDARTDGAPFLPWKRRKPSNSPAS